MENIHLLQLMHLSSSTFPTGIFSHSFGFENLYEERFVESREGFEQIPGRAFLHRIEAASRCMHTATAYIGLARDLASVQVRLLQLPNAEH